VKFQLFKNKKHSIAYPKRRNAYNPRDIRNKTETLLPKNRRLFKKVGHLFKKDSQQLSVSIPPPQHLCKT